MKFRWFRNFLKGCSLTTALFIFQACYGTGPGYMQQRSTDEYKFEVFNEDGTKAVSDAKIYAMFAPDDYYFRDSTITGTDGNALMMFEHPDAYDTFFTIQAEGYQTAERTVTSEDLLQGETIKIYLKKAE